MEYWGSGLSSRGPPLPQGFQLVYRCSISHPTGGETEAQPGKETCPSHRANSFQNWYKLDQRLLRRGQYSLLF